MAGYDTLHPNLSPAHAFVVVPNRLDPRVTVDGSPPFPASVPVETHRQASRPAVTVPSGEASSPTSVGSGLLCRRRPDHRGVDWHVDKMVLRGKGSVGIRGVLSIGGEEDMESTGSTRILGVDRNHQCRRMESAVGTLEEISSKGNWEPRYSPTTRGALHAYGSSASCVK